MFWGTEVGSGAERAAARVEGEPPRASEEIDRGPNGR
jgi:hypothetical protein